MGYNLHSCRDTPSSTSADNGWLHVIRQAPHAFNSMQHRSAGPSFGDTKLVSAKSSHNTIGLPVVDISLKGRSEFGIVDAPTCVPCLCGIPALVTVEARFFAFQRVNPSGRGWPEGAQAEMTSIAKTNRPRDRGAKFDFKPIPQVLPTASRTEKPFTAKLNPPDRSSVQLAPWHDVFIKDLQWHTQVIAKANAGCPFMCCSSVYSVSTTLAS
jgi:hypothetical protein